MRSTWPGASASAPPPEVCSASAGVNEVNDRPDQGRVRIRSLDHLVLTVQDVDATVAFYERLGMARVIFGEGRQAVSFGAQKINLHGAGAEIEPHARCPTPGSADICLLVEGPIEEVERDLREAGVPVELGPVDRTGANGPIRSLYIRDPDGNLVELSTFAGQDGF
jgi:catechol 2,3-dioxygenase-like lactoylglutathione lyase family enzyme